MSDMHKPTDADMRICYLYDVKFMDQKAKEKYPLVFLGDGIDLRRLAQALRDIGKNVNINLAPGDRGVVLWASYYIAKKNGLKDPKPRTKPKKKAQTP